MRPEVLRVLHDVPVCEEMITYPDLEAFDDVKKERERQYEKWGDQQHTDEEWEAIFNEEFAEYKCKKVCGYPADVINQELVQATAVLMAWLADRRR